MRTNRLPTYDPAGNQIGSDTYAQRYISTTGGTDNFDTAPTGQSFVRSYFDAAERMRISQRTYYFVDPSSNPRERTTYQEYFYDALGRRIAMRSQRDSTCTDAGDPTPGWDCAQTMERFTWDGDQLLKELRDYGKWGDSSTTLNGGGGSGNFYGQVTYTYALNHTGPDVPVLVASGNIGNLVPQASWRGTYEAGTTTSGSNVTSYNWPGQQAGLYLAPDARIATINANRWIGSLVEGKMDASGLVYDRNRYYDPSAGRFTQQDPAGLAGGVNLYGYAGGDPANSSDPFGLCPVSMGGDGKTGTFTDCGENDAKRAASASSKTEKFVDFSAGFGDALLFGTGPYLRRKLDIEGVNTCSGWYEGGAITSLVVGFARIGYAAAAKGISALAATPAAASAGRETLKSLFRLGVGDGFRAVDASRYTGEALRAAAGRTNPLINAYGSGVAVAGGVGATGGHCH